MTKIISASIPEGFKPTNRNKRLQPKTSRFVWCSSCDRQKVAISKKCSVCGSFNGPRTFKSRDVL